MLTRARLNCLKSLAEKANNPNARAPMDIAIDYIRNMTPDTILEMINEIEQTRDAAAERQKD